MVSLRRVAAGQAGTRQQVVVRVPCRMSTFVAMRQSEGHQCASPFATAQGGRASSRWAPRYDSAGLL